MLSPWAEQIERWLQVTRIHELLAARGCAVPYSTLRRFIARRSSGRRQPLTMRIEDEPPGEVAKLDFGRLLDSGYPEPLRVAARTQPEARRCGSLRAREFSSTVLEGHGQPTTLALPRTLLGSRGLQ